MDDVAERRPTLTAVALRVLEIAASKEATLSSTTEEVFTMKRILSALALAIVSLSAASAAPVAAPLFPTAGNFTITGLSNGGSATGTVSSVTPPGSIGLVYLQGVSATFDDGTGATSPFSAYCIDLFTDSAPFGVPTSYTLSNANPGVGNDGLTTLTDAQLTRLVNIFGQNAGPEAATAQKNAAMQLAIWDVVYGGNAAINGGGITVGGASSSLISDANTIISLDDSTAWSSGFSTAPVVSVLAFTSATNQNFVTATFVPGSGSSCNIGNICPIPEPGTLPLIAAGLGIVGLRLVRKSN